MLNSKITTEIGNVIDIVKIHTVTDCDDAINSEWGPPYFFINTSGANRPTSAVFFGFTMKYDVNSLGQVGFTSDGLWRRYRSWGTWSAWTKVG